MSKTRDKPVACVVKIEQTSRGWEAILFYRDDYGVITCFTRSESHSECCLGYYLKCKHQGYANTPCRQGQMVSFVSCRRRRFQPPSRPALSDDRGSQ